MPISQGLEKTALCAGAITTIGAFIGALSTTDEQQGNYKGVALSATAFIGGTLAAMAFSRIDRNQPGDESMAFGLFSMGLGLITAVAGGAAANAFTGEELSQSHPGLSAASGVTGLLGVAEIWLGARCLKDAGRQRNQVYEGAGYAP